MTDLIEVKTADLAGEPLNWSVAIAMGLNPSVVPAQYGVPARVFIQQEGMFPERYKPCVDWAQGGPLIEKHHIQTSFNGKGFRTTSGEYWCAYVCSDTGKEQFPSGGGGTPLIAACRAIVAAKFVDSVQMPKELQP